MTAAAPHLQMVVGTDGTVCFVYSELINLASLGPVQIHRASHVEPDEQGRWWADLSPVRGPALGPFHLRSDAVAAEVGWLERHVINQF